MSPEQARLSANNLATTIGKLDSGVVALESAQSHNEAVFLLNMYRSARASLHQLVVSFTSLAESGVNDEETRANLRRRREMSLLVISELSRAMLGSLEKLHFARRISQPHSSSASTETIGWGDATRMMGPLLTIASLPSTPPLRREQARILLGRMAKELGITESFSEHVQ